MRYVNDETGQVVTVDGYLIKGHKVLLGLGFREVDESAFAALAKFDRDKSANNPEANSMAKGTKTTKTPKVTIEVGQTASKDIKGTTVNYTRVEEKKFTGSYIYAGQTYEVTASSFDSLVSSVSHKIAKLSKPATTTTAPAETATSGPDASETGDGQPKA